MTHDKKPRSFAYLRALLPNVRAMMHGFHRIDSMQGHYNLINREEEREMIPYCKSHSISLTPYSPLAGGRLTRLPEEQLSTERGRLDRIAVWKYGSTEDADKPIIMRVHELAERRGVPMATIALAWELTKATSPSVGITKPGRVRQVADAFVSRSRRRKSLIWRSPTSPIGSSA